MKIEGSDTLFIHARSSYIHVNTIIANRHMWKSDLTHVRTLFLRKKYGKKKGNELPAIKYYQIHSVEKAGLRKLIMAYCQKPKASFTGIV